MFRRIWTLFKARNKEFYRDKSALGWNFLFPFLVIAGFAMMFNEDNQTLYKVGLLKNTEYSSSQVLDQLKRFKGTKYVEFIELGEYEESIDKLKHHKIDLLINQETGKHWVSETSPKGYIAEKLYFASREEIRLSSAAESVDGFEVPYIDWLFPGILGMNMMFSSLFGIGYVVVRYRKNGVLKRLSVTPVNPFEFLTAQVISRMFLLLITTAIVYAGCASIYGFSCRGSYLSLVLIFALGGFCMVAMGLLVASRSSSEEFAGGILNLITWPMMFLSEVWFSLEGAAPWVKKLALIFPLTHMIDGARMVMNDGAPLGDITDKVVILAVMSLLYLIAGSVFFKWQKG